MAAYYNEHDPFAAEWLRRLILFGHVADGEVDQRSIEDVTPDDLRGFTQHHFFAGIGVWSHALRCAGWSDDRPVWTGSCPCQPFSSAGKGLGFSDERHLWPAWFWLIGQCRPDVVLGEQVESKDGYTWLDLVFSDLEAEDYACGTVPFPAAGVGAPEGRHRLYWMAHREAGRLPAGASWPYRRAAIEPQRHGFDGVAQGDTRGSGSRGHAGTVPGEEGGGSRAGRQPGDQPHQLVASSAAHGVGLADADQDRRAQLAPARLHDQGPPGDDADRCGFDGVALGDTGHEQPSRRDGASPDGDRRGGAGLVEGDEPAPPSRLGAALGDAPSFRRTWRGAEPTHGYAGPPGEADPLRGFWRGADWVLCLDPDGPKWRPVEPGTFPLVDGAPARVGRLRGYGNALVGPQAQAFVEVVMEAL